MIARLEVHVQRRSRQPIAKPTIDGISNGIALGVRSAILLVKAFADHFAVLVHNHRTDHRVRADAAGTLGGKFEAARHPPVIA